MTPRLSLCILNGYPKKSREAFDRTLMGILLHGLVVPEVTS